MTVETKPTHRHFRYERQTSAGGVVYRLVEGGMEILLCGRRHPKLWCLPKGTPDDGEEVHETALREVREETGVVPEIKGRLGSIRYFFLRTQDNTRCDKTVHHYLMRPVGGDPSLHDHEFDEVRWLPVAEALELMSYPNETKMVHKAVDVVEGRVRLGKRRRRQPTAADGPEGRGGA